ncbi:hypothetical protein COV87_03370, partial [Candidatus Roizmanbacteria bacterium CG11_big_fil_rev_8_21_14_0_20_37_16]
PTNPFDFAQDRFWAKSVRIFSNAHRIKQKSITRPVYLFSLACCGLLENKKKSQYPQNSPGECKAA